MENFRRTRRRFTCPRERTRSTISWPVYRQKNRVLFTWLDVETDPQVGRLLKQFGLSEETVKRHLSNIFDKTGVSTRLELALFAIAHQLVAPQ